MKAKTRKITAGVDGELVHSAIRTTQKEKKMKKKFR